MIALAFLALAAFAAPETPIHEQIRASLAAGETALQASRWRASSEAYERVLQLMRSNSLQINIAAESQLYNNVGWAAFRLGEYERALARYEASARSCDRALVEGFSECLNKVYDNLHELVHKTLKRRGLAIEWMREGVESAARAASRRGLVGGAALRLGEVVRVRLGYLLVLHGSLDEAEATLRPLLEAAAGEAAANATAGAAAPRGVFGAPRAFDARRRALLQEAATYVGWSRAFRRDWAGASDAHVTAAALALPRDASGCARPRWRVQEGWFFPGAAAGDDEAADPGAFAGESWTVHALPVADVNWAPKPASAPRCVARRAAGAPVAGCGGARTDGGVARVRLVEIPDAFLGGRDGSALWQRKPHCVLFAGEMGASGSLPTDWGSPGVNGGLEASASDDEDRVPADALNSAPGDVVAIEAAVVLFDAREGHKMFWHHQAECVSRLALVLARLFDRDGSPAAHLPQKTRAALQRAVVLFPSSLTATVRALVRAGHGTARALERSRRLRPYEWRAGRVYSFHTAFVFDWPPPTPNTVSVEPEIWYPRTNASTVSVMVDAVADGASAAVASPLWLLELAERTAESETRRYVDSLFRLHFVPTSVLRLQAALLRAAFPPDPAKPPLARSPRFVLFGKRAGSNRAAAAGHLLQPRGLRQAPRPLRGGARHGTDGALLRPHRCPSLARGRVARRRARRPRLEPRGPRRRAPRRGPRKHDPLPAWHDGPRPPRGRRRRRAVRLRRVLRPLRARARPGLELLPHRGAPVDVLQLLVLFRFRDRRDRGRVGEGRLSEGAELRRLPRAAKISEVHRMRATAAACGRGEAAAHHRRGLRPRRSRGAARRRLGRAW